LSRFEEILARCIDEVKAGRSTIQDCVASYPHVREQLEPLLRIALQIPETPDVRPSTSFQIKARVQLMDQIHSKGAVTKRSWFRYHDWVSPMRYARRFSMVGIVIAMVLALSAIGGGTAYASQASLPGDTLYPVKLATEEFRMMLPGGDAAKTERALGFAERRVQEMLALAEGERSQHLDMAAAKYEDAIKNVIARLERVRDRASNGANITAIVGNATARHLGVLDRVYDLVPDEAKAAVARAREASLGGQQNVLAALSKANPLRASEMNLAAMNGRLDRIRTTAWRGDVEEAENALGQYEAMSFFGEEISRIARSEGIDVAELEEATAEAILRHLSILDQVEDQAPVQARPAIARARQVSMYRFGDCLMGLAQEYPGRAIHINLAAMGERMNRVMARIGSADAVDGALEQFEAMAQFSEEISRMAQESGRDSEEVEALVAEATVVHLEVLADVWERVPEQAQTAVEEVMARVQIRHQARLETMEQRGMDSPRAPVIPQHVRERVEERMREQRAWMEREKMLGGSVPPGWSCQGCRR
jgi:hypothetical protein